MAKSIKIANELYINLDQLSHFLVNDVDITLITGSQETIRVSCKQRNYLFDGETVSIQEFHRIKRELYKYMEIIDD